MEFVKENMKLFRDIGFDIEEFGENTLKINGNVKSQHFLSKKLHIIIFYTKKVGS